MMKKWRMVEMDKTIGKNMVVYRSTPENYKVEESGQKNNTVRKIEEGDQRIDMLRNSVVIDDYLICVVNTEGNWCFVRKIKDYREYDGNAIITWYEEE
jgi:hypothetical protein